VQAYLGGDVKAEGFASVNLKPGRNGAVPISMGQSGSETTNDEIPTTSTFIITMQDDGRGTATAEPNPAAAGTTVTVHAETHIGFRFKTWLVISGGVTLSNLTADLATFTMPSGPVTIRAEFEEVPINTPSLSMPFVEFTDAIYDSYPSTKYVTITNNGNVMAKVLGIALSGTNAASFILTSLPLFPLNIEAEESAGFYVMPNASLYPGRYTATIIVTYSGGDVLNATEETEIFFTVTPGSGTSTDPFIVHDVETLQRVGKGSSDNWTGSWSTSAYYKQVRNITLPDAAPGGSNWTPISFSGSYDGSNYTIINLTINSPTTNNQGLFSTVSGSSNSSPIVKNLGIVNCEIIGKENVGGVAGLMSKGTMQYCYTTGKVSGYQYVGGVVGKSGGNTNNPCTVEYCYSACNVSGTYSVGGLVGLNEVTGKVQYCYATGDVEGIDNIGGVMGWNDGNGTVQYCYATGTVLGETNNSYYVGGVVGSNINTNTTNGSKATVQYCVALNPNISGKSDVKRVVGRVNNTSSTTVANNFGRNEMKKNNGSGGWSSGGLDGLGITSTDWNLQSWWTGTAGFSATNWIVVNGSLPTLKNIPAAAQNPVLKPLP